MRIIIAAGIFPPDIGGPATYADRVARYLSERGHTVTVLCYADKSYDRREPFVIHGIGRDTAKVVTFILYLWKLFLFSRNADIVYAQGPVASGLQALLVCRLRNIPWVVKITGDYAWEQASARHQISIDIDSFQKSFSAPLHIRVLRKLQSAVARSATQVIVPSQYLKKIAIGWGSADARVSVIYNASPDVESVSRVSGPAATGNTVLTVGRLVAWKGFGTLIDLWPEVTKQIPDAKLVIVGDGPDRPSLEDQIQKQGLSNSVRMVGKKTATELGALYRDTAVFVLNSGYEGLSHTILEAMSHGVPCAVSRSGGNTELINHEKNGLVFGYNDRDAIAAAIVRLLSDRPSAKTFSERAHEALNQFTEASMLSATEGILQETCMKKKSR